jgi:hypothetical protein
MHGATIQCQGTPGQSNQLGSVAHGRLCLSFERERSSPSSFSELHCISVSEPNIFPYHFRAIQFVRCRRQKKRALLVVWCDEYDDNSSCYAARCPKGPGSAKAHGCEDTDDLRAGFLPFLDGSTISPRRPTFASEAKKKHDVIITVLHGRHRGQERPVIDALRLLDQRLALEQQSFLSAVSQVR